MKKRILLLLLVMMLVMCVPAQAFWLWSSQTGTWVNPRYHVFDSPQEQFDWAKGYFDDGDYARAIAEFKKLAKKFPKDIHAPEAIFYSALSYQKLNKLDKAFKIYQSVIEKYPLNERLADIVEQQYAIAEYFFSKKKYSRALAVFQKVLSNAPYSKVSDVAQFKIGLCQFYMRDYYEAKISFETIAESYSFSTHLDSASYYAALSSFKQSARIKDYDMDLIDRAVEDLEYFLSRFETSAFVPEAERLRAQLLERKAERIFGIARFYEKQHQYPAALHYYDELSSSYAESVWTSRAKPRVERLRSLN